MKAIATYSVDPIIAMKLTRAVVSNMVQTMCDKEEDTYYLTVGWLRDRDPHICQSAKDHYGASFGFRSVPGGIEFFGNTCGGNRHALRVFRNGTIEAEHAGARSSSGSIMFNFLPTDWWDVAYNWKWELTTYETTRKDWAVRIALINKPLSLPGVSTSAPTCKQEQNIVDAMDIEASMKAKYAAAGRSWPVGVYYDAWSGWQMKTEWDGSEEDVWMPVPYKHPTWSGVEYRRAAANGVAL